MKSVFSKLINVVTNPVGAAVGIVADIAGKIGSDKISDVVDAIQGDKLPPEMQAKVDESVRQFELQSQQDFHNFVIEHTGAAKDMPRSVQIIRGLVRPVITFTAFGLFVYAVIRLMNSVVSMQMLDAFVFALKLIFGINLLTLGFWFGDKLLQRSGLIQVIAGWKQK